MAIPTKPQRLQALRQVGNPYTVHRPRGLAYVRHNKPRPKHACAKSQLWQDLLFIALLWLACFSTVVYLRR